MFTYRFRRRVRRPRDEGIAPLSELLDKSLKKYIREILISWSGIRMHGKRLYKKKESLWRITLIDKVSYKMVRDERFPRSAGMLPCR